MRIAVIAWGSLIWCPGSLRIKTRWRPNGPALPIEFARISRDERLTLVIHPDSPEVRSYWAVSEFGTLRDARENLRTREATALKDIHSLTSAGRTQGNVPKVVSAEVTLWLKGRENVQAAVWTRLTTNWNERRGKQFCPEDAVEYLREMEATRDQSAATYERAREYVRNAPPQTQTPVRRMIQRRKGWEDAKLPVVLFETEA